MGRVSGQLYRDLGWWRFLAFQIVVMGMILSPLLHTSFMLTSIVALARGNLDLLRLDLWTASYLSVFLVGYGVAFFIQILGLIRTGQKRLIPWQILLPIYWVAIAIATVWAVLDLTIRPYHWIKTAHRPVSDTRVQHVAAQ